MNERRGQRPVADAIHAPEKSKAPAPLSQAVPEGDFTKNVRTDLRRFALQLSAMARAQESGQPWNAYDRSTLNLAAQCLELAASLAPQPQAVTEDARDGGRLTPGQPEQTR